MGERDNLGDCCNEAQTTTAYVENLKTQQDAMSGGSVGSSRPAIPSEEASAQADYHRQEMRRHSAASNFLRNHPEFDEFVRLVRGGSIRLC